MVSNGTIATATAVCAIGITVCIFYIAALVNDINHFAELARGDLDIFKVGCVYTFSKTAMRSVLGLSMKNCSVGWANCSQRGSSANSSRASLDYWRRHPRNSSSFLIFWSLINVRKNLWNLHSQRHQHSHGMRVDVYLSNPWMSFSIKGIGCFFSNHSFLMEEFYILRFLPIPAKQLFQKFLMAHSGSPKNGFFISTEMNEQCFGLIIVLELQLNREPKFPLVQIWGTSILFSRYKILSTCDAEPASSKLAK